MLKEFCPGCGSDAREEGSLSPAGICKFCNQLYHECVCDMGQDELELT